jgi:hypothetical protein
VVVANFSHEARGVYRMGFPRWGFGSSASNTDWSGYSEDFGGLASNDVAMVAQGSAGLPWSTEIAARLAIAAAGTTDPRICVVEELS